MILARLRLLAATASGRELRRQQVAHKGGAMGSGDFAQVVLDSRALTSLPGPLEPVADPVDLVEHR